MTKTVESRSSSRLADKGIPKSAPAEKVTKSKKVVAKKEVVEENEEEEEEEEQVKSAAAKWQIGTL